MRVSIRMGFTSFFLWVLFSGLMGQHTQKIYLSGTGSADAVPWQFYVTAGMQAGKWSVINVPSCWELQGFGKYNYGFAKDSQRGKEHGIYKHRFMVPDSLKGKVINIVFEGVMTDATVKLNGKLAGPAHQGAFYAFKYNISELLKYGAYNQLEVTVAKHSANASVNAAERQGDFWIFGGIFRPVWLEVLPSMHIRKVRLDANAQGQLTCEVLASNIMQHVVLQCFDANGKPFGDVISAVAQGKDSLRLQALFSQPKLWSAEQPYLYTAKISIIKQQDTLHTITRKFGFRTVTLKPRDGLYVNGIKMKLKGINRHSFRPNTGRTTSPQISREDIALIKGMNMNAVRMSHYPPDEHFLDLCDSLGLYVMDELAGWHGHYDTPTGLRLLKEMLEHDANHPSIIMWANGNEGGHNTELDEWFAKWDIQQRPVVHPWENFGGFDTQHYREYNYGIGNFEQGNEIVLPTEFLHGQFDGGHGAGLQDYWEKMWQNPLSAGGFLWDLADNAVVRRDLNDSLDTDKHRAADGIVGPYHQKEASYYAIKEIWSPIFIERREISPTFDGTFLLENRYQFTNLIECSFSFKLTQFGQSNISDTIGTLVSPNIAPGNKGIIQVPLPSNWQQYQVLYLTATDAAGMEIFTWSYPLQLPATANADVIDTAGNAAIQVTESDSLFHLQVKDIVLSLHRYNGKLLEVSNETGKIPLSNGPVFEEGVNNAAGFVQIKEGNNWVLQSAFNTKQAYNTIRWTVYPSGWIQLKVRYFPAAYFTNFAGINFSFPEAQIRSVTYLGDGPYRVWKNRLKGNRFGVWHKAYNNTETGEWPWEYPEFKGYHARFYQGTFYTANNRFTVATHTENLFLRLFTPAFKTDQWHNYEPLFPGGDISFMQGIPSIGSKTQRNETTGPMGGKNIFYDYEKDPTRALEIVLYFNFSARND